MSDLISDSVRSIREEGFCVLRNLLPVDALDACRIAFDPILSDYIANLKEPSNRGPNRHYIPLPLTPPFYHPGFFDNDAIHAILEAILGPSYAIVQYASDTPLKGSVYQDVHADLPPLFFEEPDHLHPVHVLAVNFPLIDVTPEHGPFEVARRTHLMPRTETLKRLQDGEIPFEPLLMNAGDVLVRDPRCLHRGTPNVTDTPRPVAVMAAQRSWMWRGDQLLQDSPITRKLWESLSEREQRCLRHFFREHLNTTASAIPAACCAG